jgi:hypothetical protein
LHRADLEKAAAKKLRLLRLRLQAADDAANLDTSMQIPFVQRYAVLDMQVFISRDDEKSLEDVIISKLRDGEIACHQGTIHAYNSHPEYERFSNSARKKQRMRVDRVIDRDLHCTLLGPCFENTTLNEDTDFCVQSLDGDRVLSSWYFRVSSKDKWVNALGCLRNGQR